MKSNQDVDFKELSTQAKIKVLELYLNGLKREDLLERLSALAGSAQEESNESSSPSKRSGTTEFKKRTRGNDRKRPGWELAYGKKKRSL